MKITSITLRDFLSYPSFEWEAIHPSLNVMVGPNGAGKSNLFRALAVVRDALGYGSRYAWEQMGSSPAGPQFEIAVGFILDQRWEHEFLGAFLRAALCDTNVSGQAPGGVDYDFVRVLSHRLDRREIDVDVTPLTSGVMHVAFYGSGTWQSWIEYSGTGIAWRIFLEGNPSSVLQQLVPARSSPPHQTPLEILAAFVRRDQERTDQPAGAETAQPVGDAVAANSTIRLDLARLLDVADLRLETHRTNSPLPTHRRLWQLMASQGQPPDTIDPRAAFHRLLSDGVALTENVRQVRGRAEIAANALLHVPLRELADGQQLPVHLFMLKNGSPLDQDLFGAVQALFRYLTGMEVDARLVPASNDFVGSDGKVVIDLMVGPAARMFPLAMSGAGAAEALHLAAVLSTSGRVLLLDEPGTNLHHVVQRKLLRTLRRASSQVFLATHSQLLVPEDDALLQTSRFHRVGDETRRTTGDVPIVRDNIRRLSKILRSSSDVRAMLFAAGVVLLEGETELGAFPAWADRAGLDVGDVQFFSVGSDTAFGTYVGLLEAFGVPRVVICDGPAIHDTDDCRLLTQLRQAGVSDLPDALPLSFPERVASLRPLGVLTLASAATDEFEDHECVKAHLDEAGQHEGRKSKVRSGQWIAEHYDCAHAAELIQYALGLLPTG